VDDFFVTTIWGDSLFGYSFQPSMGASGGLLIVWDINVGDVWSSTSFGHVLVIKGRVIRTNYEFVIANVYAPCDMAAKQILWDNLTSFVLANGNENVCLCGDFNLVRSDGERKSRTLVFRQMDADKFNKFIEDSFLVDMPICGGLFTWYQGDEYSMSRLDRFLLSNNWCFVRPNCVQVALLRGLSDHVPLVLHVDEDN